MRFAVQTSKGVEIQVWRDGSLFHVQRAGSQIEPQVCIGEDLFEVIAELAGLDLDRRLDADEAVRLARAAQRRLQDG
jgi:hypothetical protein